MDWRASKAHKAAFYRLPPRIHGQPEASVLADYWDAKLGEPRQQALQRWLDEGIYRRCNILETLAMTLTVVGLKAMLKERGLKVSGKKSDLLDRLSAAEPAQLEAFAQDHPVWLLTDAALKLRDDFRSEFAHEQALAEEEARKSLEAGEIEGACKVWQRYDAEQVFSAAEGTIGFSGSAELAAVRHEEIKTIFVIGPKEVAIELAVEILFGGGPRTKETRLLYTRMAFERDMERWSEHPLVIGVEIKRSSILGGCEACNEIVGCWRKDSVPMVPNKNCRNENGCRCYWQTLV
ncbi:MAG: SAP domain-containing protein [Burkholderiales bacterium]|jgi:hypothetical protein